MFTIFKVIHSISHHIRDLQPTWYILLDSVFILYTMWWSHGSLIFTSTCFFCFVFNWQGYIQETHKLVWSSKWTMTSAFLYFYKLYMLSVQFSHSVMSDSLRLHEPQHARPPYPSPTARVYTNPCPLSQWCHPTISSSVIPFSSCPQSFPASRSFQMSQLFASGGQSIGVSASASVLPMNTQDRYPLGWTGWISLQSKGLSRVFSNTTVQKHQFSHAHLSLESNSCIHTWLLEKP